MELPIVLKSRRFWTALITGLFSVIVVLVPSLAEYADTLISVSLILAAALIGGFSIEDYQLAKNDAATVNAQKFGRK